MLMAVLVQTPQFGMLGGVPLRSSTVLRGGVSPVGDSNYDTLPALLPASLQHAAQRAIASTNRLPPPPHYDADYWREERIALAHLAVWQAFHDYQPERGVPLEAFAYQRAVWAILDEWKRLRRHWACVAEMPVNEETGEEAEFEDPGAQEAVEEAVLCGAVREALERLPNVQRQILEWIYGEGLGEREIAQRLSMSCAWVNKQRALALARLRELLGER